MNEIKRHLALPLAVIVTAAGGAALAGYEPQDAARGAASVFRSINNLGPGGSFCVSEKPVSDDPVRETNLCESTSDLSAITP